MSYARRLRGRGPALMATFCISIAGRFEDLCEEAYTENGRLLHLYWGLPRRHAQPTPAPILFMAEVRIVLLLQISFKYFSLLKTHVWSSNFCLAPPWKICT